MKKYTIIENVNSHVVLEFDDIDNIRFLQKAQECEELFLLNNEIIYQNSNPLVRWYNTNREDLHLGKMQNQERIDAINRLICIENEILSKKKAFMYENYYKGLNKELILSYFTDMQSAKLQPILSLMARCKDEELVKFIYNNASNFIRTKNGQETLALTIQGKSSKDIANCFSLNVQWIKEIKQRNAEVLERLLARKEIFESLNGIVELKGEKC